jgi:S1-C subfamily serine protease
MTKKRVSLALVAVALLLATAACQVGANPLAGLIPTLQAPAAPQTGTNQPGGNQGSVNPSDQNALEALYQKVSPGVVAIKVTTDQGGGLGSGFVFDSNGHIVTNYHVVNGATQVEVDFPSGYKVYGKVVGSDPDSDLAVVKVDAPASELHPLTVGDSDALQVGQVVAAIGNPFGLYSTMTTGIVSALGRAQQSLRAADSSATGRYSMGAVIQTDAAINPGNSGGPLFNLDGEVIGLNRSIETTSVTNTGEPVNSGVGFSIASNVLKRVVPGLISSGKYNYPYLGISFMDDLPLDAIQALGLKNTSGAYVASVVKDGPADKAGVIAGTQPADIQGLNLNKGGDLVIAVDGKPIKTFDDLIAYMITHKSPGDVMTLTIVRGSQQLDIPVTLGERP